jgi:hypothetical protein
MCVSRVLIYVKLFLFMMLFILMLMIRFLIMGVTVCLFGFVFMPMLFF